MKRPLLCIAVAEEIYQLPYSDGKWDGHPLVNYLDTRKALQLLNYILKAQSDNWSRAQIDSPNRPGQDWCVKLLHRDRTVYCNAEAKTLEEAIVRICLVSQGVAVDA